MRTRLNKNKIHSERFDNFSITFNSGGVDAPEQLSMATYYPHGSVMPGMNIAGSNGYKYGYQGQFAEKDNESNENFFELRNYDPLLGRFKTIDPYGQYHSAYLAMGNSHPNSVDPDGGLSAGAVGAIAGAVVGGGVGYAAGRANGDTGFELATSTLMGAGGGAIIGTAIGQNAGGIGNFIRRICLSQAGQVGLGINSMAGAGVKLNSLAKLQQQISNNVASGSAKNIVLASNSQPIPLPTPSITDFIINSTPVGRVISALDWIHQSLMERINTEHFKERFLENIYRLNGKTLLKTRQKV